MSAMTRASVFGIDVWSGEPLELLSGARAQSTGRDLVVRIERTGIAAREWPAASRLIGQRLGPDGETVFAISASEEEEEGWRLWGDGYGEHWLSRDASRLLVKPGGAPTESWQRFLIAQALPFAAAVKGLELMHASAVVLDGAAIALLGASGAGKTTLALALCELGAGFLADDVLALEPVGETLLAHPGSPRAAVKGESERMVAVPTARCSVPLAAVVLLDRDVADGGAPPSVEPARPGHELLAATFNFVLRDPERAARLLEVCARAARTRVFTLRAGRCADAARLAETLVGHLRPEP
jgi:hypothetical protein